MPHVEFTSLWMPILVSAGAVFLASCLIWMALPFLHKNDYKPVPNEDAFLSAVRGQNAAPGMYMFPWCAHSKMDEAAMARYNAGPWGMLIVRGTKFSMGTTMPLWIGYTVIVSAVVGYIASLGLAPGAATKDIVRMVGSASIAVWVVSAAPACIWEGKPWGNTFRHMIDGVIYSAATAAVFAWLWPHAPGAAGAAQRMIGH